jgi:DNA-binding transcriptional LysR family regulator
VRAISTWAPTFCIHIPTLEASWANEQDRAEISATCYAEIPARRGHGWALVRKTDEGSSEMLHPRRNGFDHRVPQTGKVGSVELRQVRFFVAVAEDRHFGRAAERMYIAQPALSQHIRRLERELEVQLFDRSARYVRLTPAGEAFLEVARRMLRQVDEGTDAARRAEAGETGSLAVGVNTSVAAPVLSEVLRHWHQGRPAVRTRLISGSARELVDLVRRRELDLALVDGPVVDAGLDSALVVDDPVVVVLPADHPLAGHDTVPLRSLHGERFVAVARRSSVSLHDRLIELCAGAGFHPDVALEVDDPYLVPVAVAAGLAVGLVASISVVGGVIPGLVWRPVADDGASVPLVAVSAREGATAQTREFLLLVENLKHRSQLLPTPPSDFPEAASAPGPGRHAAVRRLPAAVSA